MKNEMTSIVILSYNQKEFTHHCLESIRKYTDSPYEIIVVDNHSQFDTINYLEAQRDIVLIKNEENKGFAGGCNQGMKIARGEYILLINNDTIVTKDYLNHMLDVLNKDEQIAMVGPLTNNTIGRQKISIDLDYNNKEEIEEYGRQISCRDCRPIATPRLIGFCMLFRRGFIDNIGMFDERFHIGNYEDDDLCIRTLCAGQKMMICNNSFVYHYKRATFDNNKMAFEDISLCNKLKLEDKWDGMNWNHYAESNGYMKKRLLETSVSRLLHIGCGIGALEIDLSVNKMEFIGMERHNLREKIASQYLDNIIPWGDWDKLEQVCDEHSMDAIVIEDGLETLGEEVIEHAVRYLKSSGRLYLRVFNKRHITSVVQILKGQVWGNTICACSKEFIYQYNELDVEKILLQYGLMLTHKIAIKKTFKAEEQRIFNSLIEQEEQYREAGSVYNWVFECKVR